MDRDLLVFDERMYHAGRRVEGGKVAGYRQAAKLTLSLVFGPDNHHSERLYSYFRYARRELHYKDFSGEYRQALEEHGLILRAGLGNYYEGCPEKLRMAHLRDPETMDALVVQPQRSLTGPCPAVRRPVWLAVWLAVVGARDPRRYRKNLGAATPASYR